MLTEQELDLLANKVANKIRESLNFGKVYDGKIILDQKPLTCVHCKSTFLIDNPGKVISANKPRYIGTTFYTKYIECPCCGGEVGIQECKTKEYEYARE